jgi:HD-GYP domain-containing protein (c-di-GMP phosphodiesterase class II)
VSTLRGDQKIEFDAFVKINEKHVLYLRRGDSFEGSRLTRLKEKKLKKMFILDNDEKNYRNYLERNIEMAYDPKSDKPLETRTEIVQGATQSNAENVMENGDKEEVYNETKEGVLKFVDFLTREDKAVDQILKMENLDNSIAQHGVAVSTAAVALANRFGPKEPKKLQMISLGGLLHDFEHFHSGLNVSRPLSSFSKEDLDKYKQHTILGAKRVEDKKHFDIEVIRIIKQHEECINGKGFPEGCLENKIDPLAVIVGSSNRLDRLLSFEKVPKDQIGKELMLRYAGMHPLEHLKFLGELAKKLAL